MNVLTNIKYFFHNFIDDEDYITLMMINKYFYENMRLDEKSMIEKGEYGVFFKKYDVECLYYLKRFGMKKLLIKYHSIIDELEILKKIICDFIFINKGIKIDQKKLKISKWFLFNGIELSIKISKTNKKHTTENSYVGHSMHIHEKYKDKIEEDMCFSGFCIDPDDLKETILFYNLRFEKKLLYFMNPECVNQGEYVIDKFIFKHKKYKNKDNFIYHKCINNKRINYRMGIKENLTYASDPLNFSKIFNFNLFKPSYYYESLLNLSKEYYWNSYTFYGMILYGFFPISPSKNKIIKKPFFSILFGNLYAHTIFQTQKNRYTYERFIRYPLC